MDTPFDIIQARASQAVLVFDKFHIVRHLMAAVDQVRRDEIREKGPAHKALLHKTRFIWLKNPWNLTEAQHQRLGELERLNLKINRAYLLKELFAHFWSYRRAGWAKRYLKRWFWWATHSRLSPLRDFAWMLRRHQEDILNYFRMPINNGAVEGLNNKAKLIIHKAYGFRTAKNYIRNLYHCMADLPLCAGSAGTGERALRGSVDAALRAGIFKASGSIDPMGFGDERERGLPRP